MDKFLFNPLMKPIIKNLLYYNTDKWMKKLSVIPQGIPNNKQTEYKIQLESGIDKVTGQSLII